MNAGFPSAMRRFLVTGGAGFIGSHVGDHLLAAGAERVTVIDDFNDFYDPRLKWKNIAAHLENPAYRLVAADIRDRERLERVFREGRWGCGISFAAGGGGAAP